MESFQAEFEEFVRSPEGGANGAHEIRKNSVIWTANGQLSWQTTTVSGGREKPAQDLRRDGSKQYIISRLPDSPALVDWVTITPQNDPKDEYSGPLNIILWLLRPGGRSLPKILATGGTIAKEQEMGGSEVFVASFSFRGRPVRCELDPNHDWLPRRISFGGNASSAIVVDQFARVDGRWYPLEGYQDGFQGLPSGKLNFRVTSFRWNQPSSPGAFAIPRLQEGAVVFEGGSKPGRAVGGLGARDRFTRKHYVSSNIPGAVADPTARPPGRGPSATTVIAAVLGSISLGFVGILRYAKRMRPESR